MKLIKLSCMYNRWKQWKERRIVHVRGSAEAGHLRKKIADRQVKKMKTELWSSSHCTRKADEWWWWWWLCSFFFLSLSSFVAGKKKDTKLSPCTLMPYLFLTWEPNLLLSLLFLWSSAGEMSCFGWVIHTCWLWDEHNKLVEMDRF